MDLSGEEPAVLGLVELLVADLLQLDLLPADLLNDGDELAWGEYLGEDLDVLTCDVLVNKSHGGNTKVLIAKPEQRRTGKTTWVFERREHVRARVRYCVSRDGAVRPQRRPVSDVGARLRGVLLEGEDVHGGVREVFEVEVGVDANVN